MQLDVAPLTPERRVSVVTELLCACTVYVMIDTKRFAL
jgi:hypothetical protein